MNATTTTATVIETITRELTYTRTLEKTVHRTELVNDVSIIVHKTRFFNLITNDLEFMNGSVCVFVGRKMIMHACGQIGDEWSLTLFGEDASKAKRVSMNEALAMFKAAASLRFNR